MGLTIYSEINKFLLADCVKEHMLLKEPIRLTSLADIICEF
jgi:hypothetical protein